MSNSRSLSYPLSRSPARGPVHISPTPPEPPPFALLDLEPAVLFDPPNGVQTGGSRLLTASDKAHFKVANNAGIQTGNTDFTVGVWIYWDGTNGGVVARWDSSTSKEYNIFITAGTAGFTVTPDGSSGTAVTLNSSAVIPSGSWSFILAWHDAVNDSINIQVNNGSVDSLSHTLGVHSSNADLVFGARLPNYVGGRISRSLFSKRILTTAEKTYLYNAGAGRSYGDLGIAGTDGANLKTNLISYWNFSEASGTAYDAHGTNHLTPTFAELITNGGFETLGAGGADVFGSWTESVAGTSTVNDETVNVAAGSHACRLDVDASDSSVEVQQTGLLTSGNSYAYSLASRHGGSGVSRIFLGTSVAANFTLTTSYQTFTGTGIATGSTPAAVRLAKFQSASASIYFDSVSVKANLIPGASGPGASLGVVDGDPVIGTLDQSGNGRHATQANAPSRLVYKTNIINGKPVLRADGADDYFLIAETSGFSVSAYYFAAVVVKRGVAAFQIIFDNRDASSDGLLLIIESGLVKWRHNEIALTSSTNLSNDVAYLIEAASDGTTATLWVNGTQEASASVSASTISETKAAIIGARSFSTPTSYFNGDLGPLLLVPNAVSPENRTKSRQLLATEYGILLP